MSSIILLIAALNSLNVHGSKEKCEKLIDPLIDLAVNESIYPYKDNLDEDLKLIKKFRQRCERKVK